MADAAPLIDAGMVEFLRGPVAITLGTTDATGVADAARAAVLASDVTDYRSLQWKGRVVAVGEERTPGDLAVVHRQVDLLCEISPSIGVPSELARRLFAIDVLPVVVEVDAVVDQTLGKGAGRCIGGQQ